MCNKRPAPRCASHTRARLQRAQVAEKRAHQALAATTEGTPEHAAAQQECSDAAVTTFRAQRDYDMTATGRRELLAAAHRARMSGDTATATALQTRHDRALARYEAAMDAYRAATQPAPPPPPQDAHQDYRISHCAPTREDACLTDLTDVFGNDVYDHPDYYSLEHAETLDQIRRARSNPDATVTIYRAVPPGITTINEGDWVALSREYAEQHAWELLGGGKNGVVISTTAKARNLFTEGNSLEEWGYDGDGTLSTTTL